VSRNSTVIDLNIPELLDGPAQAVVISSVLGRPVGYLDVSVDEFIGQLKNFGLPAWMVEAFAVALPDPDIPGDQSSAEVERILHRKPGTLKQFIKDYRSALAGLSVPICSSNPIVLSQFIQRTILKVLLFWRAS
jgi:hypothetical protein